MRKVQSAAVVGCVPGDSLLPMLKLGVQLLCELHELQGCYSQNTSIGLHSCLVQCMKFRCKHIPSMLLFYFLLLQWFTAPVDQRPGTFAFYKQK